MNFVDIVNFFGTTGSQLPFNIKLEGNRYYLINNPNNKVNNIPLVDGIYFELIQGTLDNQNGLNQNIVIKLKNPNNIQVSSSYVVRLYNQQNGALLGETYVPTSCEGIEVSFTSNVAKPLITIEGSGLILFTSNEYLSGYIPLDQRIYASFRDVDSNEVFRAFFVRELNNKRYFTSLFRSSYNKFLNTSVVAFRYLDVYKNNQIIGNLLYDVITEFKFPQQYRFLQEQEVFSVSSYSILLLSFYKDFVEKLSGFFVKTIDTSQLERSQHNFLYSRYFYNKDSLSYEKLYNYVDLIELLLALLVGTKVYGLLDSSRQLIDDNVNHLRSFTPQTYYPDSLVGTVSLIPDFINSSVEEQYSLATNLLFAHILNKLNMDSTPLISEINRVFVNNGRKTINRSLGDINTFTPLEAAIIVKFAPTYLNANNSYVSSLISDSSAYLYNVEYINAIPVNSDINSDSFNPIYNENLSSSLPFYDKRVYINLFINVFLDRPIQNFMSFSSDGAILDSYKFSPYESVYILPSLRANLTYFFLSLENILEGKIEENREVILIDRVIRNANNQLVVELTFNVPVKVLCLISHNSSPVAYASSLTESNHHILSFLLPSFSPNYNLEIYVLE